MNLTQLTPYEYVSGLIQEQIEDTILQEIELICLTYLTNNKETFLKEYKHEEILVSFEFLMKKIEYLGKVKEQFKFKKEYSPFVEIGHAMDLVTLQDHLSGFDVRSLYFQIMSQTTLLLRTLTILLTTVEQILHLYEGETDDNQDRGCTESGACDH